MFSSSASVAERCHQLAVDHLRFRGADHHHAGMAAVVDLQNRHVPVMKRLKVTLGYKAATEYIPGMHFRQARTAHIHSYSKERLRSRLLRQTLFAAPVLDPRSSSGSLELRS